MTSETQIAIRDLDETELSTLLQKVAAEYPSVVPMLKIETEKLKKGRDLETSLNQRITSLLNVSRSRLECRPSQVAVRVEAILIDICGQLRRYDHKSALSFLCELLKLEGRLNSRGISNGRGCETQWNEAIKMATEVAFESEMGEKEKAEHLQAALLNCGAWHCRALEDLALRILDRRGQRYLLDSLVACISRERKNLRRRARSRKQEGKFAEESVRLLRIQAFAFELSKLTFGADVVFELFSAEEREKAENAIPIAHLFVQTNQYRNAREIIENAEEVECREHQEAIDQLRFIIAENMDGVSSAQKMRWTYFKNTLSLEILRDFLAAFSDERERNNEEKGALLYASEYADLSRATAFLCSYGAAENLAELVLNRINEFDFYDFQTPTDLAQFLESEHPLAATLLYRGLIDFAFNAPAPRRYYYTAQHFAKCERLSDDIVSYCEFPTHDDYSRGLVKRFHNKDDFWSMVQTRRERLPVRKVLQD